METTGKRARPHKHANLPRVLSGSFFGVAGGHQIFELWPTGRATALLPMLLDTDLAYTHKKSHPPLSYMGRSTVASHTLSIGPQGPSWSTFPFHIFCIFRIASTS